MGNIDTLISQIQQMKYNHNIGEAIGALNGAASDVGTSTASVFATEINGGTWQTYDLNSIYANMPGGSGSTSTTTDNTTNSTSTTTSNNTTTNNSVFDSTTNITSQSIIDNYSKQTEALLNDVKDLVKDMETKTQNALVNATKATTDEYGNELAVDAKGNKYDPEKVKAVQDILDSEAKQIEFERLAKQMDSAIEGENSEHQGGRFFGLGDGAKEKQWKKDSAEMSKTLEGMSDEEMSAFNEFYKQRSKVKTGVEQTPAMALNAVDKDGRDIIKPETIDKIAKKSDAAAKWLKELPTGKTQATKDKEAKDAEAILAAQADDIKKIKNKVADLEIEAQLQRDLGNETVALKIEAEIAKLQNDYEE